ncbi:MAG: 16S rRNA (adenine(1518)-N(6)/adenine(1519)-N(6)) -dimethyltransferase RsmA [Candidatus Saccharimonadales bacterium]
MIKLPDTKKALGQHWLTDTASLQAMVDAAHVTSEDTVLEIGPGAGTLTELLVARAQQVIAVEFDADLARSLPKNVPNANLQVIQQDILRFDFSSLPINYKIVANIPYYLTSNLIRIISETSNPASEVALLIQKEVAERVAAQPGKMSLLTVSAQFYWTIELGLVVPASFFTPPPKVDSQIIMATFQRKLPYEVNDAVFFRLVKAGFAARRKTLLNSLSAGLRLPKAHVLSLLEQAGIAPNIRPQELSINQWYDLYKSLPVAVP